MKTKDIGVLVDAENARNPLLIAPIVKSAQAAGRLHALVLFGNWDSPALEAWKSEEFKRQLAQWGAVWQAVPKTRPGKNAADIALTFEAALLARDRQVTEIWLVSGDSDFTPMIERLQASNIRVVVFGPKNTTEGLRAACSSFVLLDDLENGLRTIATCHRPSTPLDRFPAHQVQASVRQIIQGVQPDSRGWFHGFVRRVGRQFGFIQVNPLDSIFFHASGIDHPMSITDLRAGDPVEFKFGCNDHGVIAVHVRRTFGLRTA